GCGAIMTQTGTNVSNLTTKDMVHQEFGQPKAAGVENGHAYEEFLTYKKIAEPEAGEGVAILDFSTLFLAELVLTPMEIYRAADGAIEGQTLHFAYDEKGNVVDIHCNGKPAYLPPFNAAKPPTEIQPSDDVIPVSYTNQPAK